MSLNPLGTSKDYSWSTLPKETVNKSMNSVVLSIIDNTLRPFRPKQFDMEDAKNLLHAITTTSETTTPADFLTGCISYLVLAQTVPSSSDDLQKLFLEQTVKLIEAFSRLRINSDENFSTFLAFTYKYGPKYANKDNPQEVLKRISYELNFLEHNKTNPTPNLISDDEYLILQLGKLSIHNNTPAASSSTLFETEIILQKKQLSGIFCSYFCNFLTLQNAQFSELIVNNLTSNLETYKNETEVTCISYHYDFLRIFLEKNDSFLSEMNTDQQVSLLSFTKLLERGGFDVSTHASFPTNFFGLRVWSKEDRSSTAEYLSEKFLRVFASRSYSFTNQELCQPNMVFMLQVVARQYDSFLSLIQNLEGKGLDFSKSVLFLANLFRFRVWSEQERSSTVASLSEKFLALLTSSSFDFTSGGISEEAVTFMLDIIIEKHGSFLSLIQNLEEGKIDLSKIIPFLTTLLQHPHCSPRDKIDCIEHLLKKSGSLNFSDLEQLFIAIQTALKNSNQRSDSNASYLFQNYEEKFNQAAKDTILDSFEIDELITKRIFLDAELDSIKKSENPFEYWYLKTYIIFMDRTKALGSILEEEMLRCSTSQQPEGHILQVANTIKLSMNSIGKLLGMSDPKIAGYSDFLDAQILKAFKKTIRPLVTDLQKRYQLQKSEVISDPSSVANSQSLVRKLTKEIELFFQNISPASSSKAYTITLDQITQFLENLTAFDKFAQNVSSPQGKPNETDYLAFLRNEKHSTNDRLSCMQLMLKQMPTVSGDTLERLWQYIQVLIRNLNTQFPGQSAIFSRKFSSEYNRKPTSSHDIDKGEILFYEQQLEQILAENKEPGKYLYVKAFVTFLQLIQVSSDSLFSQNALKLSGTFQDTTNVNTLNSTLSGHASSAAMLLGAKSPYYRDIATLKNLKNLLQLKERKQKNIDDSDSKQRRFVHTLYQGPLSKLREQITTKSLQAAADYFLDLAEKNTVIHHRNCPACIALGKHDPVNQTQHMINTQEHSHGESKE